MSCISQALTLPVVYRAKVPEDQSLGARATDTRTANYVPECIWSQCGYQDGASGWINDLK